MTRHWGMKLLAFTMMIVLALSATGLAEATDGAEVAEAVEAADAVDAEEAVNAINEMNLIEMAAMDGASDGQASGDADAVKEPDADGETPKTEPGDDPRAQADDGTSGEATGADAPEQATKPDVRLGVGERYALEGASGPFQSDRPEIASVDAETGVITANATGVALITAPGTRCVVGVFKAPKALSFGGSKLNMGVGELRTLTVRLPDGTASASITYTSSKKSVVTVDGAGNLRARKSGTALITAKAYNGAKATCTVKVAKAPASVKLSAAKLTLCVAETAKLKAKLPSGSASRMTWTSSDPAVATVDASGRVQGVGAGTAKVVATAFNGKKASCKVTVLAGKAPTKLFANAKTVKLGVKEKYTLSPSLGEGENTVFAYASKKKKIASVSAKGVITGKKTGTTWITVSTHNGLKATVKVKVVKAPGKVTLSRKKLSIQVGQSTGLSALLPSGTASAITWTSSAPDVAAVDADGNITAIKAGSAVIRAQTYNKKRASCTVTVIEAEEELPEEPGDESTVEDPDGKPVVPVISAKKMLANLRDSSALGSKKAAIINVMELLIANGFDPAFAAGVGANIYAEGTYGLFESSRYVANPQKRPRYFCYLDGGEYYASKDGGYALIAVYMSEAEMQAYTGEAEARLRFGAENFYLDNYSRKYAQDVDLNALEALMEQLAAGGWEGKFGLGIVQWTGARTRTLVSFYRKHAGPDADRITAEQVVAAENEMILSDFKGSYSGVYAAWRSANDPDTDPVEAARSAGALVCTKYEIPADKDSKAVTRGNKAAEMYKIMIGS